MKHFRHITLTAALLAGSVISVQAGEIEFTAPDINNELSVLVDNKINALTRETEEVMKESGVVEHVPGEWTSVPAVTQEVTEHEQTVVGSKVL